jgi:hypothetical protein
MRKSNVLALALCGLGILAVTASGSAADRFPVGDAWEGLPLPGPHTTYSRDPGSFLNELHGLLFIDEQVPAEVGAALPSERQQAGKTGDEFFQKQWYFAKRPGKESDRRTFGGDVRVSPVLAPDPRRTARLLELLPQLSTREQVAAIPELQNPLARLLLQWDLLSVWWRFEQQAESDAALQEALARSIAALGQPRAVLEGLPSGAVELRRQFAGGTATDHTQPFLPESLLNADGVPAWPELGRKSTKLFHAGTQLRASRVFLHVERTELERALAAGTPVVTEPIAPDHPVLTALVLTLMAIDDRGEVVATPVIDEVRVRASLTGSAGSPNPETSSHDGSSHWIYFRSRRQSLLDAESGPFRFVPDTAQSLFLEYGTAKHTPYFAQCELCHRLTNSGNQSTA